MARKRHNSRNRRSGFALILVLFAVAIAVVLALGFSAAQSTSVGIANNAQNHTRARTIAETGLNLAISHVQTSSDWRDTLAHGVWINEQGYDGGTFTLIGEDGEDTDGDGIVDGDGDLSDDNSDKVTLTAIGTFNGVRHRVRAVVTAGETPMGPIAVLMVVDREDHLSSSEESRIDLIESWGWTVELIEFDATQGEYDAALADVHVVYVPEDGGGNIAASRLVDATLGVVFEDGDMNDELHLASSQSSYSGKTVRIVDNTHYVTAPFSIGEMDIATSNRTMECPNGTISSAVRPLGWYPDTEARVVAVIDAGQSLLDGNTAAGRRTVSPFGGFWMDELTNDGKTMLKRMLEWSAQSAMTSSQVEPLGDWDTGTHVTKLDGEDRLLVVTVGAETHASISSISYGYQPLTLAGSAYESTGVGARTYIYYLREVSIEAATDNVIRTNWTSGSRDDESYSSRFYQYVNQTSPIRDAKTATNAGPQTVATPPMTVSNGDVVVGSAQVGNPLTYTWEDPLVLGTNDQGSTSGHSAADYEVTDNPGTVVAAATCSTPNRQGIVGIVVQPRSQASGEGAIPQLLVLYEFDEETPTPVLRGHWTFDDDGSGGALAIDDDVYMEDASVIDGYRSADGAYGGANQHLPIIMVTNTSDSGGIHLQENAVLYGTTYNRHGANPTNVVDIDDDAVITGSRFEQSVDFDLPGVSSPSGMPSNSGDQTFGSGNHTINSDKKYDDLTINSGATITIKGNVRIQVTDDFRMYGGTIELFNANASLELYVGDDFEMHNSSVINPDTTAAARVKIFQYNGDDVEFSLNDSASLCGIVRVEDDVDMYGQSRIYGAVYCDDDLTMDDDNKIHIDMSLPGYHIVPVIDAVGTNHALAHGGVTFGEDGAKNYTDEALRFDGDDDFVIIPHHDDYLLSNATISFWFKSESLYGDRALFSKDSSGSDTGGHLTIYTDGSTLKARIQTDGSSPYGTGDSFEVSSGGLSTNTWYHVTLTIGAGGLRLYRDGTLVDSDTYPGGLGPSGGGLGNFEPIVIGAGTTNSGDLTHLPLDDHFEGWIDDVRIYQEVLDAGQVAKLKAGQNIGDRSEPSYIVRDTSGQGDPLDLTIENTGNVEWLDGGGLSIDTATVLRAAEGPSKVRNGVTATGQFSIEFVVEPSVVDSTARRLLWYGPNTGSDTNLDVRMQNSAHTARVRSSDTSSNPPAVTDSAGLSADTEYHVLITYNGELVQIYRDGALVGESTQTGNLLSWDTSYGLTVGNLPLGGAPWLGTIKRMAIYDRAMNQRQTDNLVAGLPPGDGATMVAGGVAVRWFEFQ